ncbi:interleukin-7 isoform X3 [Panthera pardus]|uniref:Interleukin-7 n=4 Tax=Felidae TaxID=9681 RepID=A0A6J0A5Z0_ACIJB|nr:interleukin-7 isoform X2 [Panthera tigris]XP_014938638.2 interleukin-7 isoform X2 [Acinonyx jubatus]XP_019308875.1 interleukin-7 isoform X3 [Panthera pardus]XP_019678360.1 interleukin-7 isoform X3 [Felis catus]XP_025778446.1 interleukin-7 isoform X3 [Puma concolor]XP_030159827.1 interleukin-7 isoform X3 [Lynx canadensis]XP_042780364.1 interleukin-7 isoform X2 [Panthera leo]XP_043457182.1 interleukin-7 isoform X2 [Prionailurus bengalensis]XP_045310775.1 interleukin-7 isoform X2 [Leopardus
MFHVSFRYIFGIPPLILVLLPVASSDCDIEGKDGREYQHILMISINYLEAVFLYRAAHKLKHFVKVNNSEEFNLHLSRVSQGMLQLLNCTPKEDSKSLKEQRKQKSLCFLGILLQKIKTCWNKILRGSKEH